METSKERITRKATIDCPVCRSGNRFQCEDAGEELACDDCGFVLAQAPQLADTDAGRCVFCGGEYFYVESPLPLLGKHWICYICGAKYKGALVSEPGQKYNSDTHAEAQQSDAAKGWRQRVELYNQGTG